MNDSKQKGADLQSAFERTRLLGFEREARDGLKIGPRDRLVAAFHLTRAWNAANANGLKKQDFQDQVLSRLQRGHKGRQEFRLANWTLKRGEDPRVQDLRQRYEGRSAPQLAMEPYLVGIAVAAQHCGADPVAWKLEMLRELKCWVQAKHSLEVQPTDDRPAETLAALINAMCGALGRRNSLRDVLDAITDMNCRWEMFGDRLVATDAACLQRWSEPIWGAGDYFEEAFPFPSVSLVRIPYLESQTTFLLAPEKVLEGKLPAWPHSSILPGPDYPRTIPDGTPGLIQARGTLMWFRDIHLCVLPDAHGGYTAGLQSRPHAQVRFDDDQPFTGLRTIIGGYEPDLSRSLFYARSASGGLVWPHVLSDEGEVWRICLANSPEVPADSEDTIIERDPGTTGWQFDQDPVSAPGQVFSEPWYLSYTPATPDYLRHWLCGSWQLGNLSAQCDWLRADDWDDPKSRWNRNLPPIRELNFPDHSIATWIECCLHNDLIGEALQASIDRLKAQVAELQANWLEARERNAQKLLTRWHPSRDLGDAN